MRRAGAGVHATAEEDGRTAAGEGLAHASAGFALVPASGFKATPCIWKTLSTSLG
jgi:hypothetical protein